MFFNKLFFFVVFLLLLVSTSLLPPSMAGRPIDQSAKKLIKHMFSSYEEISRGDDEISSDEREMEAMIHERVLRVNTKDYGRYDPAPTLVKPPFKLIPN